MLAKDLSYFAAIAEKGSLAKAALSLNVSQPALTKCVRRLETQLQVKLFNRTPDGASPEALQDWLPCDLHTGV